MQKKCASPLVSIIIPVYNGENYVAIAIESALAQTYENKEIIVVDDGSTDDTKSIVKKYKNIKYFYKKNGGVASALNYGIKVSKGKYISWLSHDDKYDKDKILEEVEFLRDDDDIVVCNVTLIDKDDNIIEECKIPKMFEKSPKTFLAANPYVALNGCAMLIPKVLFEKYGVFNETLKYTQDYDLWFRFISNDVKFRLLEKNLMFSRQHDDQDSRKYNKQCTIDSDIIHASFLEKIEYEEFFDAFDNSVELIEEYFNVYYCNGYYRTSAFFMKIICKKLLIDKNYDLFRQMVSKHLFFCNYNNDIIIPKDNEKSIMFYSNAWTKGGIERVLSLLMPEFAKKYNVFLVNTNLLSDDAYKIGDRIKHIILEQNAEEQIEYTVLALCLIYDIKIFVGNPNIIDRFLNVYPLLKSYNIKTVAINHYYYFLPYYYKWLFPIVFKRNEMLKSADIVVWLTKFNCKIYNSINQNGIQIGNPSPFKMQKRSTNNQKIILCVGRFYDSLKRVDRMFKIFKKVLETDPDAVLWLVGDYDFNFKNTIFDNLTMKEYYDSFNFPKNSVVFWGRQDNIKDFYKKASLLLLTSESEGLPMTVIEAITCGLPCVSVKINGLEDLMEHDVNALIENQDEYEKLAIHISKILNDKELANKFSNNSYKKAQKYEKKNIVAIYENVFDLLLKNKTIDSIKTINNNFDQFLDNEIVEEYERAVHSLISIYNEEVESQKIEIEKLVNDIKCQADIISNYDKQLTEMTQKYNDKSVVYVREEYTIIKEIKYLMRRILRAIKKRVKRLFHK